MLKLRVTMAILAVLSVTIASSFTISGAGPHQTNGSKVRDQRGVEASVEQAAAAALARGQAFRTMSLNVPRSGHTSTALADGRVLVAGGVNSSGQVAEVEVIDTAAQASRLVGTLA